MPFPFVLPTTSAFSYSSSFTCETHPSLPLNASTYRGVVRDTLKKHKRLPPISQAPNLPLVISSLTSYLPYLSAVESGLGNRPLHGEQIKVATKSPPAIEWRPTLSESAVPGKEAARCRIQSLEQELSFVLSSLANAYTLQARSALQPLYVTSVAPIGSQERHGAITAATKHLLDAASVYDYLAGAAEHRAQAPPACAVDISAATVRAQRELALAEATLLAVLKDDPYPAVAAQDRNKNDMEWMFKAPDIPKVRAHLFARLCLAASEHAAQAYSLCQGGGGRGSGKVNETFVRYLEDLRRTSRARACRFFGIDAELGGQTGNAIGWLHAALQELGVEKEQKRSGLGFSKLRKEWSEKREDRKVERSSNWGADAGKLEETRMNTQLVPPPGALLAQMPSGREIHQIKAYEPPVIDASALDAMRAPPEVADDYGNAESSEDEGQQVTSGPGQFPGTKDEYEGRSSYY
ncbi:uncharacterized protein E0L32_003713 [Thyridium curvatum]|uniref:pH-response regulator protein palC n=1 Tax=Thyridium curvatum TaxID=1093900 RepID=A0A507BGG8_9PEZI|nr:uncharacterized protein E0L32_003713 [Thyridium curvatum]TPX16419.1 hypothetical protein E0L32_003713 [Thyridium curvatum]